MPTSGTQGYLGPLAGSALQSATIIANYATGSVTGAGAAISLRNCAIARTAVGRYTVTFSAAHPDGANYEIVFGQADPANLRDVPKVSVVTGSRTANGFNVQVTTDDNGGTADVYADDEWSFIVPYEVDVITGYA